MAEGQNGKKVYHTRYRKRSSDVAGKSSDLSDREESVLTGPDSDDLIIDLTQDEIDKHENNTLECAICLQNCIHPAKLPCGHIFCFLCVKGAAHGNKKCAMCRSPIPHNYFHNPELLENPEVVSSVDQGGYQWFYEGRQGWWQYDTRASGELEKAWESGACQCELLIAGYIYIIDLKEMYQARKGQPSRRRKIKRDVADCEKLGVAGLRDQNVTPKRDWGDHKSNHEEEYDYEDLSPGYERSWGGSSSYYYDGLEEQFSDLTFNNSEDDDDDEESYQ